MSFAEPDRWTDVQARLAGLAQLGPTLEEGPDEDWLRWSVYSRAVDSVVADVASERGLHRVLVQGQRCRTTAGALRSLGDALELPGYYGQNLDALDECLPELLEIDDGRLGAAFQERVGRVASGLLVVVDHADLLLVDEPPDARRRLMSVLRRGAHPTPDPLGRPEPRRGSFAVLLLGRGPQDR